jgi:hypothetical protein
MSSNQRDGDATADPPRGGVRAVVERYRDEPNQCTIFPATVDGDERVTTWITAETPWYVDLWEHR